MSGGSSDEPRRTGPWRRRVLRVLAVLIALVLLAATGVFAVLHSLERPWVKRRVQGLARTMAGVEIDYRSARIEPLSGAAIEELVVGSPPGVRSFAPDLVRVGRVDARWSLGSIILGRGPAIERLVVSDVALTVVIDEQGRTSFDALGSSPTPAPPTPAVPLSRRAAKLLATPPAVGELDVDRLSVALVRTEHGVISERNELGGISLNLASRSAEPEARGWRVTVGLGSTTKPLELRLARIRGGAPSGEARASFSMMLDATSSAVRAALDLRMIEQTFAARVSADHWLHADANVRFDGAAGRTEVRLDHAEAGDGAATAEGSVEVPDTGDAIVRRARADIDLGRLLRWLPPDIAPIAVDRARVHFEVDSLALGPVPHLAEGGALAVDGDLSNVTMSAPYSPLGIGAADLRLHAQPAPDGAVAAQGSLKLAGAKLTLGVDGLAVDDLAVDFDGHQGRDGALAGRAGIRFVHAEDVGASSVVARDGALDLRVAALNVQAEDPLTTRGDVALSVTLGSVDARSQGARAMVDGLTAHVHAALEGHAPYAADLKMTMARLRLMRPDGAWAADAPARFEVEAHDVQPVAARPVASRGVIHAAVDLGDYRASLDATKDADAADFAVDLSAKSLKDVRPLVSPALASRVPWARMAVVVRTRGRIERMSGGDPAVRQTTEIDVERPAFEYVAARSISLTLKSRGTALKHEADLELRAHALAFGGGLPSDDRVTLTATVDREQPSLQLQVATEGLATSKLSGSLSFDRSRRELLYRMEAHLAGLGPLAPFAARARGLEGFDLSQLEVDFSSRGAVVGAVAGVTRDGTVNLQPSIVRTAAVEGSTDLHVAHFRWSKGDTAIVTPALTWHGDMHASGSRRTLVSHVEMGTLHIDLGSRDVDLSGIADDASVAAIGNLAEPELELVQRFSVHGVEQTLVPEYPMGDIAFALSAERSPEGVVHISDMKVANALGGTALDATGNLDLSEGRHTLSVTTSLTQDLGRLSTIPDRFKGSGQLAVEASVTSPDVTVYNVRAAVKGSAVSATLPRAGIEVDAANGEVPITVVLDVGASGVELRRSENRSPYSMLRFADQHPLLSRSGFLSIARLKTPFVSIAPLVGNLEVEQNVISLRQFEMGVRGGTITGQCGVDWDGLKSTLELHVRANGVQSSHGEPFDGNIAVAISLADRTIDGRAEILRIGERHLLDLLDLQDPLHVDPAMNRIRGALRFGYPDNLRLVFDHGFASAHLELGGLARLVSIGELRGIPMGPIVDRMIAHMLETPDAKETP
jgi:translocation and assembly module TamB